MAQIQSPETYVDGQQVTAARLNNQTNGAVLLPGAVTDQTALAAGTVATGDTLIVHDLSASALRKATASDILNSNLPVTTSAVSAGASSDLTFTPNDAGIVSGASYSSGDGLTVTVNSTAHGLSAGQVILVTLAGAGYNGTFQVATTATNSFTYVMPTAATAGSGTLSYTKKGTVRTVGNQAVTGSVFVAGRSNLTDVVATGTANFTGTFQVNGSAGYVLYEVSEETMTPWTAPSVGLHGSVWLSSAFTKPSDEIWYFDVVGTWAAFSTAIGEFAFRYQSQTLQSGQYIALYRTDWYNGGTGFNQAKTFHSSWFAGLGTTFTNDKIAVDAYAYANSQLVLFATNLAGNAIITGTVAPSRLRVYKYKTA